MKNIDVYNDVDNIKIDKKKGKGILHISVFHPFCKYNCIFIVFCYLLVIKNKFLYYIISKYLIKSCKCSFQVHLKISNINKFSSIIIIYYLHFKMNLFIDKFHFFGLPYF